MAAFLIVQRGEDIGRRFDLDTTQLTVGRGSDNDMVLNDPMVSRYHAVVKRQGNGYLVIDLGSSNPVVINEHVCEPGEPRILQHRDVVFIGKTVFSFQSRSGGAISGPAARQQPVDRTMVGVQVGAEADSPTPPPPSRQSGSLASGTPAAVEEKTASPTPKIEGSAAPATPPPPPTPPASEASSEDDKTVVAGMVRNPEQSATPFMPPPPPPSAGRHSIDDDSTRPTPGMPPMGAGAPPPPPPPPAFAPPRPASPTAGGPVDEGDGDMPTQIVPRRP